MNSHELVAQALGIPPQSSHVYTAKTLLRTLYKKRPDVIRDTTTDLRDLPFIKSASAIVLRRDLERSMIGKTCHLFDKNSMYLSAARATNLGVGEPVHIRPSYEILSGLPGIYRITALVRPVGEIFPVIKDGQEWMTNDLYMYARSKGYEFVVSEAYQFLDYAKILDKWAAMLWGTMQYFKGQAEEEAYREVKTVAHVGLGSFATGKDKYTGLELIHPNWFFDVVGKANVNLHCNMEKYAKEAGYPVLIETDGLYYVPRDKDYRTAVPGILDRIGQLGGYKHQWSVTITQELYDKALGATASELARLLKAEKEAQS